MAALVPLDPEARTFMLGLARETVAGAVLNKELPEPGLVPSRLMEKGACFVTLTLMGSLRGCIGNVTPQEPLYQALIHNASDAAQRDPRFLPVQPEELEQLQIEISVLTEPEPLAYTSAEELLEQLRVREHGVILQIGSRIAIFLPQVWETIPDKIEFLNRLSQKAGCSPGDWRGEETAVSVFHAESFQEDVSR